jgi:serine/threonine-protein kinase
VTLDPTAQSYSDTLVANFIANGGFGSCDPGSAIYPHCGILRLGITNEGRGGLQIDFGIDVFYASASPSELIPWDGTNLGLVYSPDSDSFLTQIPVPQNGVGAGFESGSGPTCDGGDCHYLVIDAAHQWLVEAYQASVSNGVFLTGLAATLDDGALAIWPFSPPGGYPVNLRGDVCTSADAGGFAIAPMLVTVEEVAAALDSAHPVPINHAIRLVLPNSRIASGRYIRPATHTTHGAAWAGATTGVPYGARFRLKSNPQVQAKIAAMSSVAQVVAVAMQDYGMILADGGSIALSFKSDTYSTRKWSDYPDFDSHAFFESAASALVPTDFDVVNIVAPDQYLSGDANCVRNNLGLPN